jgi:predicted membrane protein
MKSKTKNTILAIFTSVVAIFVPALIFGKWIEAIFFFFCHWLIREQFPKQYHHIVHAMCRLITSIVFFFGVSFILPFELSLFSAIPINYFIGWVGFTKKQCDDYEVKYERLKEEIEKKSEFNTDTCTKEQLIARCEELHFSKEKIELAIEFFINKTKQSKLADKLCVEEHTIAKRKLRIRKQLNNKD